LSQYYTVEALINSCRCNTLKFKYVKHDATTREQSHVQTLDLQELTNTQVQRPDLPQIQAVEALIRTCYSNLRRHVDIDSVPDAYTAAQAEQQKITIRVRCKQTPTQPTDEARMRSTDVKKSSRRPHCSNAPVTSSPRPMTSNPSIPKVHKEEGPPSSTQSTSPRSSPTALTTYAGNTRHHTPQLTSTCPGTTPTQPRRPRLQYSAESPRCDPSPESEPSSRILERHQNTSNQERHQNVLMFLNHLSFLHIFLEKNKNNIRIKITTNTLCTPIKQCVNSCRSYRLAQHTIKVKHLNKTCKHLRSKERHSQHQVVRTTQNQTATTTAGYYLAHNVISFNTAPGKQPYQNLTSSFIYKTYIKYNEKICLLLIALTVEAQQQLITLQKAPHLPGKGRSVRNSCEQATHQNSKYLDQLVHSSPYSEIYSKASIRHSCTNYICYNIFLQIHSWAMTTSGGRKVMKSLMAEEEEFMEIDIPYGTVQKRPTGKAKDTDGECSNKKSRSEIVLYVTAPEKRKPSYWMGFSYMEQLAVEAGIPECTSDGSVDDLVAKGYIRVEVEEMEIAIVAFPRIAQKLYPSKRSDKVLGQHYNITQLPFEVETHPDIGLSLDFHITIYFEQPKTLFEHDEILAKAQQRFEQMEIPLGKGILHPITVFCKHTKQRNDPRIWAGIIKAHLL
jgi:hypothetical protein